MTYLTSTFLQYKYANYLPVYDNTTFFPPTEPFDFTDKGTLADKEKPHLFNTGDADVSITKLTPRVGSEVKGLQLSKLSDVQKNELALLIAERGVVIFRGQDFKVLDGCITKHNEPMLTSSRILDHRSRKSLDSILESCTFTYVLQGYFDLTAFLTLLMMQATGAHVKDHIELHNIYLGPDNLYRAQQRSTRLTTTGYHSDVSYEHQTPGITVLTLLQVPSTGGDTAWVSQVAAYERLSEPIQRLLEGLRAEHSGFPQAEGATRDGKHVRRAPVISNHPIVRVHPVTGQKALFVNPGFTKKIVGLKDEESDALLKLLFAVSPVRFCPLNELLTKVILLNTLCISISRAVRIFRLG